MLKLDVVGQGVVLTEMRHPAARAKFPVMPLAAVTDEIAKPIDAGSAPGQVGNVVVAQDLARLELRRSASVGQIPQDMAGLALPLAGLIKGGFSFAA